MSLQRLLHCVTAILIALAATAAVSHGASAAGEGALPPTGGPTAIHSNLSPTLQASPGLSREVFGFALAGTLGDPTVGYPSWNFSLLSTVAFFALHISSTGAIVGDSDWATWNSSS